MLPSPVHRSLVPSPTGLVTVFYCLMALEAFRTLVVVLVVTSFIPLSGFTKLFQEKSNTIFCEVAVNVVTKVMQLPGLQEKNCRGMLCAVTAAVITRKMKW